VTSTNTSYSRELLILAASTVLLHAFASPSRAEDNSDPCALQWKASTDAIGTPGFAEAQDIYRKCTAIADEQKKAEFAATRDPWAASLERLPNGGWTFLMVSPDGTYAVFGSHRHATREGNIVALWLRYEHREQQTNGANGHYKSDVEREMYDCARVASKGVATTYYPENNLGGVGPSYTYEEAKVAWSPAIPGTVGDFLLDWACKTTPRAQSPAKSK
jgi:hypothetical protein